MPPSGNNTADTHSPVPHCVGTAGHFGALRHRKGETHNICQPTTPISSLPCPWQGLLEKHNPLCHFSHSSYLLVFPQAFIDGEDARREREPGSADREYTGMIYNGPTMISIFMTASSIFHMQAPNTPGRPRLAGPGPPASPALDPPHAERKLPFFRSCRRHTTAAAVRSFLRPAAVSPLFRSLPSHPPASPPGGWFNSTPLLLRPVTGQPR